MKSKSKEKGKYIIRQNTFYTFSFSFHFINLQKLILKSFFVRDVQSHYDNE